MLKMTDTLNSDVNSNNISNIGCSSRSGRIIKPRKYPDYDNDTKVRKLSRLSKVHTKSSEEHCVGKNETDNQLLPICKTKGKLVIIHKLYF